jgi:anthranilate synthase component 1
MCEDRIHATVGAGIVAGSVPEREFEETEHKAGAVRRAIELAIAEASAPSGPASGAARGAESTGSGTTTPRGATPPAAAAAR